MKRRYVICKLLKVVALNSRKLSDFKEKTLKDLLTLSTELELSVESNRLFNFTLIVSIEDLTKAVKSLFTTKTESKLEEIDANLRFRVFKIAARAGNK
jgi:hypothetical protein